MALRAVPPGSARDQAVRAIAEAVRGIGLGASPAPSKASQLGIELSDAERNRLSIFVEPASGDGNYYKRNDALGLWYSGADSDAPSWTRPALAAATDQLLSDRHAALAAELAECAKSPAAPVPAATESEPADEPSAPASYKRDYVLGASDVETFFHVDYEYEEDAEVEQPPTCRIGIIYQCNQTCTFCQLAEMNTHIPPERIYAALDSSREKGATRVIITGGEPTMCRHLVDYIRYARAHGFETVEMQSNAIVLDKKERAVALREAGLTDAQISLHGPDSDISDKLTAAPGTHQRTLAGIGNLLDAGVRVLLNHLIFKDNAHLLSDYIDMVEQRWGQHRHRLILQFHTPLNEFARIENARRHIARYSDYAERLLETIDKARELGYRVQDLGDPTGIPALCVLDADSKYLGPILSQAKRPRFHRWESGWVTRVAACAACDLADSCMGIPKPYLAVHGDGEFRPVKLPEN